MVLPAPAPDDAPGAHGLSWLTRLSGILRLVKKGVLVLVDEAVPARLGELTRSLLAGHPELEVHTDALRLARCSEGALVILVPDPAQASWLNMERPLFANRALRTILFSSAETTGVLARRAPDFFSWISHHIPCPPGLPLPALRGLQAALCARAPGVVWRGGDLHAVFEAALPGRPLAEVSAALPYAEMLSASKPEGRGWVAWSEVDGPFRLRRVRWAAAEAGRRGRTLLVAPSVEAPGFACVDGRLLDLAEARALLEEAGAPFPGRLAAMLELEQGAVSLTLALLWAGVSAGEIEAAVLAGDDAGAAVAKMAAARGIEGAAPLRARRGEGRGAGGDPVEEMLRARKWGDAAEAALGAGDPEVAVRWARQFLAEAGEEPRALYVAGRALSRHGQLAEAETMLRASTAAFGEMFGGGSPEQEESVRSLAAVLRTRAKYAEARALLRRSLTRYEAAEAVDRPSYSATLHELAGVLMEEGDFRGAESLLRKAIDVDADEVVPQPPDRVSSVEGLAVALGAQGKYAEAEGLLRKALLAKTEMLGRQHPSYSISLRALGIVLDAQGRYDEAESLLREALAVDARALGMDHPSCAADLHALANVVHARGEYARAESLLRESMSINQKALGVDHPYYAASLHALASVLQEQGRYPESEALLRQSLSSCEKSFGLNHPSLAPTLVNLASVLTHQGRAAEGEAFALRAMHIAEASLGARHPDFAKILVVLAWIQMKLGKHEARVTAERAMEVLTAALGPEHPTTRSVGWLLEATGSERAVPTEPPPR